VELGTPTSERKKGKREKMSSGDTEKMLEEYKKDMAEEEKADYDARTPEEKTAWLRFQRPPAAPPYFPVFVRHAFDDVCMS
jgi:hypothetical protein